MTCRQKRMSTLVFGASIGLSAPQEPENGSDVRDDTGVASSTQDAPIHPAVPARYQRQKRP